MLARTRASLEKKQGDAGFTLIELLVVVIIIGILAAIAIPVYLNQKKKAVDSSIVSDTRSLADAEETYAIDHQDDPLGQYSSSAAALGSRTSNGNKIEIGISGQSYCIRGSNPKSSATGSPYFWFDSSTGGIVTGGAQATPKTGTCATASLGFAEVK